jgi:excisionase family DNA binding protein
LAIEGYQGLTLRYALPERQDWTRRAELGRRKKPDRDIERIFFTFAEAQEFMGVSHQTLYRLMGEGLPSHKVGRKRVFLKEDLERWIREH